MDHFIESIKVPPLNSTVLEHILEHEYVLQNGAILEFGVYTGTSINMIARRFPNQIVYGFDGFEGLPERWDRPDMDFAAGFFNMHGDLPNVQSNVQLIKGWFNATLPEFLCNNHIKQVALLHIDCDLYSSTKCIFEHLRDCLTTGTIIVFDELFEYPQYEHHELLALYEEVRDHGLKFEWIGKYGDLNVIPSGRGAHFEAAAIRVL